MSIIKFKKNFLIIKLILNYYILISPIINFHLFKIFEYLQSIKYY